MNDDTVTFFRYRNADTLTFGSI